MGHVTQQAHPSVYQARLERLLAVYQGSLRFGEEQLGRAMAEYERSLVQGRLCAQGKVVVQAG